MIVLGFDTATRSTAVALRLADGRTLQARDDPPPDERPGHATRLLGMADELLAGAGIGWSALQRIAVGRGPGTFTGLRVGVATARGLAQSLGIELVGVSSLRALAEPSVRSAESGARVLAVLDARRGEAFVAAYEIPDRTRGAVEEILAPVALAPENLRDVVARGAGWEAVGDGAVRFRGELEAAGVAVAPDASPAHLLSAEAICELGARAPMPPADRAILPEYGRRPDAEIALDRRRTSGSAGPTKGEEALAAEAAAVAGRARGEARGEVDGS